jgi:dihydrofolate reductase
VKPLTLIVAMTPGGVIAKNGAIPWKVSEDLKRFKTLTTGHSIIMGRKTYESIGRPLPNRTNIVLMNSKKALSPPSDNLFTARSLADACELAYAVDDSPFVIGGGEIYKLAMPLATRLEITYVAGEKAEAIPDGGEPVYFPFATPDLWDWKCIAAFPSTETLDVEFVTFERRSRA